MKRSFEEGDLDIRSAVGWNPDREHLQKLIEANKKKNPRGYARPPDMLFVRRFGETTERYGKGEAMKQLFGPFWLESELAVLYSPPGVGKSALAVQIGEHLARGVPFPPFKGPIALPQVYGPYEDGPGPTHRVLYLDFELSYQQHGQRYAAIGGDGISLTDPYRFARGHFNMKLSWNGSLIEGYEDFTDMLFENLNIVLEAYQATILIVDNVSFLSQRSTANSAIAFRLMKLLQELKWRQSISVLALAHTPKHREHLPITMNHLQGSVDIAKVADSIFVLGRSYLESDLRYIKHVKSRTGEIEHGGDNVPLYRLAKFDLASRLGCDKRAVKADNFLGFDFVGFDDESCHLGQRPGPGRQVKGRRRRRRDKRMVGYAKTLREQGLSMAAVAERLRVAKTTAHRYLHSKEERSAGGRNASST